MADTQCDINAFIDQVHRPVEQRKFRGYRRKRVQEVIQDRAQNLLAAKHRRRQGERATRHRFSARRHEVGLLEVGQQAPADGRITHAGFAQPAGACCAMEKLRSDMAFKEGHGAADRGGRASELAARRCEAAFIKRGNEDLHNVNAVHRVILDDLVFKNASRRSASSGDGGAMLVARAPARRHAAWQLVCGPHRSWLSLPRMTV